MVRLAANARALAACGRLGFDELDGIARPAFRKPSVCPPLSVSDVPVPIQAADPEHGPEEPR